MHDQPSESAECHEDAARAPSPKHDSYRMAAGLFHHGPIVEQVEQQISLLTVAMAESMIYASGAFPDLTEGELPETPQHDFRYGKPAQPKRATTWSAARSLQLHDAARMSFATASLVSALTKLKTQPCQRFTTRQTLIPDADGKKKPRKVTTFTHTLFAPREEAPVGAVPGAVETAVRETQSETGQ